MSVIEELKRWIDTTGFKVHFPIEVRFTKADDIYLSPCYGQDSCYINIVSFRRVVRTWKAVGGRSRRDRPRYVKAT